jgi:hypothetical protein
VSFEVYVQCFGEAEERGIARARVRALFPVVEEQSELDYWMVRYDEKNWCHIWVKGVATDREKLKSLCVERPCGDLRL